MPHGGVAGERPTAPQTVLVLDLFDRPLVATFDRAHARITALAEALPDPRAATRGTHPWSDVLAQRIFGIACGYPDADDIETPSLQPLS